MKKTLEVQARAPYDELRSKLFNARVEVHRKELERDDAVALLEESRAKVRSILEAERVRIKKRNAAWRFAGYLTLLCLFSFGCVISVAACLSYGPWWTAIAPAVLLALGAKEALKS